MSAVDIGRFFSAPNEVRLDTLAGAPGELVTRLIGYAEVGRRSLLPARLGPTTRWYGLAPTGREERVLREEFRSWLGPPFTSNLVTVTAARDGMDQAVLAAFDGWKVLSVDVLDSWQQSARDSVTSLLDVWSLAPERSVEAPRPVGRVLRQFYEAILGGSREDAEGALAELRARSLINPTNLRFLRVHMLSELATPQELRDDLQLQGLTLLARPPAVTEKFAEAANALTIQPLLASNFAWEQLGAELERDWPGLVTDRHQITTPATARCFALAEITLPSPRGSLIFEIAQRFPNDPVLGDLAARWGIQRPPAPPASAVEHYHRGDYDFALLAAEQEAVSRTTVSVALASAVNLTTSEAAARALTLFERLDPAEQFLLRDNAVEAVFLERLRALTSDSRMPAGWLDWLRGSWTDRPDLLVDWSQRWDASLAAAEAMTSEFAVELLDGLNDDRRGRIRNGLPVFVDALLASDLSPSSIPLAVTLLDILLSSEPGRIERQASLALLDEILAVGCTAQEYSELLAALEGQLSLIGPRDASWLIQVLDLLLLHSCPDSARRDATLSSARATAHASRDRLDPLDLELLSRLFPGLGFETTSIAGKVEGTFSRHPRSVGIYSLLESSTRQAADWIRTRWPDVDVRTSSEHVNSDALTALAKGVEVLLVQTSHAKHAATQALEAAIPDRSRLVLVNGRGATSLVRALMEWSEHSGD